MSIITLTSDFGPQDYLTGAVKGQLMTIDPGFKVVDISHQISPFNYAQAAYVCKNALRHFPEHTCHLLLINLFDKKPEQLLLAYHKGHYFLGADNGLLTMILEEKPDIVIGLPLPDNRVRNTLYCTQIMGHAVKLLQEGMALHQIGIPDVPYVEKHPIRPMSGENWLEGQILFIDQFENIVVNITRKQFEESRNGRGFRIVFRRDEVISQISETYADVPESQKLALFNSADYLEIAINKGNAAGLFGLQHYTEKSSALQSRLFYQTVRILFQ